MSTQSIYSINNNKLHDQVDEKFISWGTSYTFKVRFGVGEYDSVLKMKALEMLDRALCDGECFIDDEVCFKEKINILTTK